MIEDRIVRLSAETPDSEGFLYRREIGDRLVGVMPQTFGRALVGIGPVGASGWDDVWDFPSRARAVAAALSWDPRTTPEPSGWHRHRATGRYRPDGDPLRQYKKEPDR